MGKYIVGDTVLNIAPKVTIIALNAAAFPPVENNPAIVVAEPS